jgi:hypothetical protein
LVLGQENMISNNGDTGQDRLSAPYAAELHDNRIYVADSGNHRVLIWNSIPTIPGADADLVLGQTDFTTDTPGTSSAKLDYPHTLLVCGERLFVGEQTNNRIVVYE